MAQLELSQQVSFLSELYREDAASACLLTEYPSSNSDETNFQNRDKYIIHDPFPPPPRELLKILGPHHLMCGWGKHVPVSSQIAPPKMLLDHWDRTFGSDGCPNWRGFQPGMKYITQFPHQALSADEQVIDPDVNYAIHSKEVIEKIDCPQAKVLDSVKPPCIVKLSHGYAGLGNFLISDKSDEAKMREQLDRHWPDAALIVNSIIENINGDFGVQFYLRRDGTAVWLGLTEQLFDGNKKWCGGTFSEHLQTELFEQLNTIASPTADYLHECGYFGLVGIDILRDTSDRVFLVDVNPRLTGVSPFLMASRIFAREGLSEGVYKASCRFQGSYEKIIDTAERYSNAKVLVLSAYEDNSSSKTVTICHLSASSETLAHCERVLAEVLSS